MKKIFSLFAAVLFAGSIMAQAPVGTTLFSEDFSSFAKDAVPSGQVTTATGRVVYGDATVTYTTADGGTSSKIYEDNLASGTSPEILISKSNGSFTIAGIPSGGAKAITVSYKQNKQKLKVESTTTGYSGSKEEKPTAVGANSLVITVADGAAATFDLVFTCTGSSNVRVDDIAVTVKTAEDGEEEELTDPTNCAEAREAALSVSANNELYNGGKVYTIEGYVTSIQNAWKDGIMTFWMADKADGGNVLEAYKCAIEAEADAVNIGDKVAVTGKLTKYNTTPEFAAGCTVEIKERTAAPENLGEKTIAQFIELKNTKDTCILTGKVTNIESEDYGNLTIEDATGELYIYGVLTAAGEKQKFNTLDVEVNDVLTVKAIYNEYQGNPQAKNAIFVSREKATVTAIDNVTVAGNAQKMIIDGQLFIIRDGVMFNANGAAVK